MVLSFLNGHSSSKRCLNSGFVLASSNSLALWARYNVSTMNRLKVAYNNIMRRLVYVPQWKSASFMFGNLGVRSFQESIRNSSYSLLRRIDTCPNDFIVTLSNSDAALISSHRRHWRHILYYRGQVKIMIRQV